MPVYDLGKRRVQFRGSDAYVAPSASLVGSVIVGDECTFWFGAVVRGDNELITIGDRTNLQDGCVVHADPGIPVAIGANVSVGHMAMLHGCTIGDGSLIGIGAVILNRAVIGRNCLVGAKTLIPERKTYPDGVLILGQPGKVMRELRSEELAMLREAAESYVKKARRYRAELALRAG
jgi:carbonic anhydrase/acetyltransferase-like protein (isoleucine patch superfamily)